MGQFVKPTVFVSGCIEFDSCRFDGTMIASDYVKRMKEVVHVIHACPELAIGLGAPRESIRLVKRAEEDIKLLSNVKGLDHTAAMNEFTNRYLSGLQQKQVDGFLLKAKSPTCGVGDVKIYQDTGKAQLESARNDGIFGGKIRELFPDYPIETERRISNYTIREEFFTAIFTMASFRAVKSDFAFKKLVQFHSSNKYLFMSYNQNTLRSLGQVVANHNKLSNEDVLLKYEAILRQMLKQGPTKKRRINVLYHIYGYFKNLLSTSEKEFYFDAFDDYVDHRMPYSNVLTILRGFAVRFSEEYLLQQTVFQPFPKELLVVTDSGNKL